MGEYLGIALQLLVCACSCFCSTARLHRYARYVTGLSSDEFGLLTVTFPHVAYRSMIDPVVRLALLNTLDACILVVKVYIMHRELWGILMAVEVACACIVNVAIDVASVSARRDLDNVTVEAVLRTYPAACRNGRAIQVPVDEYVTCVRGCFRALLFVPTKGFSSLVKMTVSTCTVAFFLKSTMTGWWNVAIAVAYVTLHAKMLVPRRRRMKAEWSDFASHASRFYSVRKCLDAMVTSRQMSPDSRISCGSDHASRSCHLRRMETTYDLGRDCMLATALVLMAASSGKLSYSDPSLVFYFACMRHMQYVLGFLEFMMVPKEQPLL